MVSSDVLNKARRYCVYQERSQQELREKLYSLGLFKKDVEESIAMMVTEGYLNEERFAIAYAGGRFRIKHWGKNKIKQALKLKKVSDYCIRQALKSIADDDYLKVLNEQMEVYKRKTKENNAIKKNYKVAQQLIARGFEADEVWKCVLKEK